MIMNNEEGKLWSPVIKLYSSICLEDLRKNRKRHSQVSRPTGHQSNPRPSRLIRGVTTTPRRSDLIT